MGLYRVPMLHNIVNMHSSDVDAKDEANRRETRDIGETIESDGHRRRQMNRNAVKSGKKRLPAHFIVVYIALRAKAHIKATWSQIFIGSV